MIEKKYENESSSEGNQEKEAFLQSQRRTGKLEGLEGL